MGFWVPAALAELVRSAPRFRARAATMATRASAAPPASRTADFLVTSASLALGGWPNGTRGFFGSGPGAGCPSVKAWLAWASARRGGLTDPPVVGPSTRGPWPGSPYGRDRGGMQHGHAADRTDGAPRS